MSMSSVAFEYKLEQLNKGFICPKDLKELVKEVTDFMYDKDLSTQEKFYLACQAIFKFYNSEDRDSEEYRIGFMQKDLNSSLIISALS